MLSKPELQTYMENGYLIPSLTLPDTLLADIRKQHATLVRAHPEFTDYCPALLAYDRWFLRIARRAEILELVGSVLGNDFALWNMSFFAKPPYKGSRTPWHQDGEYWPIEPLATCTVWIAVDDSHQQNGCLRVIPGSHKSATLAKHHLNDADGLALNRELNKHEFSEHDAKDIILKAGQMSIHDVFLFHGSEPNHSESPRRAITLRFMPTSSVYQHDKAQNNVANEKLKMSRRTLFLASGKDLSASNDFSDKD